MAVKPESSLTTVRTVLEIALRDAGIVGLGQQPSANDINECFLRFKWMLDLWQTKRWMSWHLVDMSVVSTGAQYYTIGVNGDIALNGDFLFPDFHPQDFFTGTELWKSRPLQIEFAFARLFSNTPALATDYPLRRLPSYEDYAAIRLKSLTSFPTHYFYDPVAGIGKIFFWPIPPAAQFEMHVLVRNPLYMMDSPDDTIRFPYEYIPAIELNLAKWMRMSRKFPPDPQLDSMAKAALNAIRVNNTQIQTLKMPAGLARGSRRYNIFSDEP